MRRNIDYSHGNIDYSRRNIDYSHLFLLGTGSDTGSVILEEMLWTLPHTGGPVGVLPVGVPLPLVLGGVVDLHGRTLLFTDSIIIKILAGL